MSEDIFYTAMQTINTHVVGTYPPQKLFGLHVSFRELQDLCHLCSYRAGWWNEIQKYENDPYVMQLVIASKIALMHSELSESLEGSRKNLRDEHLPHRKSVEVEFADAIIRILDTAEFLKLDVSAALIEKLAFNATRADHKPENRAKQGGKKI